MTKDEALKLALEGLEHAGYLTEPEGEHGCTCLICQATIAVKEALAQPECHHRIADARNKVVKDGYICVDCGALFSAADHNKAQPEQEPVVWMYVNKSTHEVRFQKHMRDFVDHGAFSEVPLFSEPLANQLKTSGSPIPQRKPLTDEQIEAIWPLRPTDEIVAFARAIEAKLKEMNT